MALENAAILSELKERYANTVKQLNELSNTRIKIEGAIDVLQQIEDSKAQEAQAATKSEGVVGESDVADGEPSSGSDSSAGDSGANDEQMSVFQSDVVRAEMVEISELQEEVYSNVFKFPSMPKEDQHHHVDILERLIEKQQIMYTRLSLSDDPEAKKMKEQIIESAKMMGIPSGTDMNQAFSQMAKMVDVLKKQIDRNEFTQ